MFLGPKFFHFCFLYKGPDRVFENIGICLLFSDFELEVLRWSGVAPTQPHHNGQTFAKCFELLRAH